MKKILLNLIIYTLLISFASCNKKPTSYSIKGTINSKKKIDSVSITDYKGKLISKVPVKKNKFIFLGKVKEPTKVNFYFNKLSREMILENAIYTINITDNDAKIIGGTLNKTIYGYKNSKIYRDAIINNRKATSKAFKNIDMMDRKAVEAARAIYLKTILKVIDITTKHQLNIIEGDYPTLTKLFTISYSTYKNTDKFIEILNEYKKELPNNQYLDYKLRTLTSSKSKKEIANKYTIGKTFKDLTLSSITGKKINLSDVVKKNKYTLLEFWASWCGPCRGSFPHIKKAYAKYNSKGFEVFGISLDKKEKLFLKASKEEQLPWINTVDYASFKSEAAVSYGVTGIPYSVLIDQNGIIVGYGKNIRDFKLEDKLKELFTE